MRDWLFEGFRYNLWANRIWAEALTPLDHITLLETPGPWPDFPRGDPNKRAEHVFLHIIWVERVWLERCGGVLAFQGGPNEWTQALLNAWIAEIDRHDPAERIDYHRFNGDPMTQTFAEIVAHVLRHGAYHRGQLREIFELVRPDDIPQT